MKTDNRVLYFSINPKSVDSFYSFLDKWGLDCQCSFRAIEKELVYDKDNGNALRFKHTTDLLYFLNAYGEDKDLGYLYVILDYPSFFNFEKHCSFIEHEMTNELESFSVKDAAKIIRRAILQYPEVFFMFDESWNTEKTPKYPSFLFSFDEKNYISNEWTDYVWTDYHKYSVKEGNNPFDAILRGRTSMFDGSNLRYAIKQYEYNCLNAERLNFSLVQDSRAKHLAICIEEEHSQNRFNSYSLYANGYRVMPVFTSKELKYINQNATGLNPKLIVRDYDLQFPDVDDRETPKDISESKEHYIIHTIDYIRGAKYIKESDNIWNKCFPNNQRNNEEPQYLNKWLVPSENAYWDKLLSVQDIKVLFVSKGIGDRMRLIASSVDYWRKRKRELGKCDKTETSSTDELVDGVAHQIMRGTTKPISGIYTTFSQFETIKERYNSFEIKSRRQFNKTHAIEKENALKEVEKRQKESPDLATKLEAEKKHIEKTQEWYIDTNRENHAHGVPLDIYDSVRNMLERAQKYYDADKFIRSAIISSEVIEILNGFHEALVLQAYHILAISENAIAMNTIGGNEEKLSLDTNFRISKIVNEVDRLMDRPREGRHLFRFDFFNNLLGRLMNIEEEDRRKLKYNILNQIFSDCRSFCKEKEHFDSENRFISAMAHVNEGYKYTDILLEIKENSRKWVSTIRQFIYILCYAEKS